MNRIDNKIDNVRKRNMELNSELERLNKVIEEQEKLLSLPKSFEEINAKELSEEIKILRDNLKDGIKKVKDCEEIYNRLNKNTI